LFVVFAGKKQPKHVRKNARNLKKLEVRSDDDIFFISAKCTKFEVSSLELQVSSLGLGVFDEVSVSPRNFNRVSVSKVTVSTTSLSNSECLSLTSDKNYVIIGQRRNGQLCSKDIDPKMSLTSLKLISTFLISTLRPWTMVVSYNKLQSSCKLGLIPTDYLNLFYASKHGCSQYMNMYGEDVSGTPEQRQSRKTYSNKKCLLIKRKLTKNINQLCLLL